MNSKDLDTWINKQQVLNSLVEKTTGLSLKEINKTITGKVEPLKFEALNKERHRGILTININGYKLKQVYTSDSDMNTINCIVLLKKKEECIYCEPFYSGTIEINPEELANKAIVCCNKVVSRMLKLNKEGK